MTKVKLKLKYHVSNTSKTLKCTHLVMKSKTNALLTEVHEENIYSVTNPILKSVPVIYFN